DPKHPEAYPRLVGHTRSFVCVDGAAVKFIFADSLDLVDPNYDFLADRPGVGRQRQRDDKYPHELMNPAPYDGVLVSRGIVGDHRFPGKYPSAQAMRFRRD